MIKTCTRCLKDKSLTDFYQRKNGYINPYCKECSIKAMKEYKNKHKEEFSKKRAKYYIENKETILSKQHDYYILNSEHIKDKTRKWRQENCDRVIEYRKEWREKNREKNRIYQAEWSRNKYSDPIEQEKRRVYQSEHRKNNPDLYRAKRARRRAGELSNVNYTKGDVLDLYIKQSGKCIYCHCDLSIIGYHVDHIIPLTKNGTNNIDNIQLTCPSCNLSKGNKNPEDFIKKFNHADV